MSAHVEVRTHWCAELDHIATHMRQTDVDELWTLTRTRPREVLERSLRVSGEVHVGFDDGEPVAVFGTATAAIGRVGVPWLLGTDKLTTRPLRFMRWAKRYVAHIRATHTELRNVVDAANVPSIRFLEALGFEVLPPHLTMTGTYARQFHMKGDVNV